MSTFIQRGGWLFAIALLCAIIDWIAVARRDKHLEYIFKPATLIAILAGTWLLARAYDTSSWLRWFFLAGLYFSLLGDVFLMLPGKRYFLPGLISFFLAHVCYIVGLNPTPPPWPALLFLVIPLGLWLRVFPRIREAVIRKGQRALVLPTTAYGLILVGMFFSASAVLFRADWPPAGRAVVFVGGALFFASDAMLAWDRFVRESPLLHILVIVTYHLAQMALGVAVVVA